VDLKCGVGQEAKWNLEDVRGLHRPEQGLPKNSYPLPKIDKLVDAMDSHALLSFMDAFSGYH